MQEQNFEKQVREKMDELSFVPSAPVWEKVEEQIRSKKEKRRIIFWLLPLMVCTGLGWWLIAENGFTLINKNNQTVTQHKANKQPGVTPGNNLHPTDKSASTNRTSEATEKIALSTENTTTITTNKKYIKNRTISSRNNTVPTLAILDKSETEFEPGQLISNKEIAGQDVKLPVFNTITYGFNADSILNSRSLSTNHITRLIKDKEKEAKPAKPSKWQLAFAVQGGISGISENFISFGANADMLYYASPTASIGGGFGNAAIPPSSKPSPNAAFSAGIDVKRRLSKRLSVVSGMHYAYYSTSMKVGSTVYRDTLIGRFDATAFRTESFYRNDGYKKGYTNQFHFIQIPVGLEFNLTKKLPLNIQTGVKFEQLLSSNALFYNQSAGVYVNDKQMLTKTTVNVFGGFSYHFRSQKAFSFAVGPKVQYSITNLSKNKSNSQHLYFMGISTQMFFKK